MAPPDYTRYEDLLRAVKKEAYVSDDDDDYDMELGFKFIAKYGVGLSKDQFVDLVKIVVANALRQIEEELVVIQSLPEIRPALEKYLNEYDRYFDAAELAAIHAVCAMYKDAF